MIYISCDLLRNRLNAHAREVVQCAELAVGQPAMAAARQGPVHGDQAQARAQDAIGFQATVLEDPLEVARPQAGAGHVGPAVGRLAARALQRLDAAAYCRVALGGGKHLGNALLGELASHHEPVERAAATARTVYDRHFGSVRAGQRWNEILERVTAGNKLEAGA